MGETVGIIGVGRMGSEIGKHVAAAGHTVVAFDVSQEALQRAKPWARLAGSSSEVAAESGLVIVLVATDKQVLDSLAGPRGMLDQAKPGLVVAISSSVAPPTMRELERLARPHGVQVVDAPLVRGEKAARDRELLVYFGGDGEAVGRATAIYRTFCSDVVHVGGLTSGQVGKLANNALLWTALAVNREMDRLAERYGVDLEKLREALLLGSGSNWVMAHPENVRSIPWAAKDMEGVRLEAERLGVALPVSDAVRQEVSKLPGVVPLSELHD